MKWFSKISHKRRSELFGFLLIILALFILLSLATRTDGDDRWIRADRDDIWLETYYPRNLAGTFGALVSFSLYELLGWSSWFALFALGAFGVKRFLLSKRSRPVWLLTGLWAGVFTIGVIADLPAARVQEAWDGGLHSISGQLGRGVAEIVSGLFGVAGGSLVLGAVLALSLYWAMPWARLNISWPFPARKNKKRRVSKAPSTSFMAAFWKRMQPRAARLWHQFRDRVKPAVTDVLAVDDDSGDDWQPDGLCPGTVPQESLDAPETGILPPAPDEPIEAVPKEEPVSRPAPRRVARSAGSHSDDYEYPALDLLAPVAARSRRREDGRGAEILKEALSTFDIGIDGGIESFPGPVITRYEFRPAPGIKVNQVVNLSDDLALALSASRVRVVAPVPGKSVVGIEIPNPDPEIVGLAGVLGDRAFTDSSATLPLALGETTEGRPFVVDLAAMPHLLIAGATGSGKSVCINVIITSILFRHHPRDVRLLFIDPKMLELSMYQGIPHLERPVVTNPRAAERLLVDAVREMDDRYRLLANAGVRNIADYNRKIEPEKKLPYIVIVVDELADLMLSPSATKIEMTITRLAQMARAVGIHLILATQRPSVDVITGLIKANFSCRIAFQVATKVDSRTILDANGAEKLLGRGDMLFLSPGRPSADRTHGAFVSSDETTAIVDFLKTQVVEPDAIQNFTESSEKAASFEDDHGDLLFHQAADVVIRHKQGSVSLLQRRLGIGYQRAARLIDKLEEAGVVGAYDGSKAREVLWTREDYDEKFAKVAG